MKIVRAVFAAGAALVVTAAILFFFYDRIAVAMLERRYGLDIRYKGSSTTLSGSLDLKGFSVLSRRSGLGLAAGRARFRPYFSDRRFKLSFDLRDVNFVKRAGGNKGLKYDTLAALVSTPFDGNWKYARIRGTVEPGPAGLRIDDLAAASDQVRLSLKGDLFYNGTVESEIVVSFAPGLAAMIAPELAGALSDEKTGWKSVSARISGDPDKPSIEVSSKLFRLTIKALPGA